MALSRTKKLNMKRRWLVVSGDASLHFGKILSTHKTEVEARKARPLFGYVRMETIEEVERRLRTPELPGPCYFMLEFRDYSRIARELWRIDGMGAKGNHWTMGGYIVLSYGHDDVAARRFQSAAYSLQVECDAHVTDPSKELRAGLAAHT